MLPRGTCNPTNWWLMDAQCPRKELMVRCVKTRFNPTMISDIKVEKPYLEPRRRRLFEAPTSLDDSR